jgi:V/A-type H+-transporting ATPase subunit A
MGEVIGLRGEKTVVQVYEDTSGIRPGEVAVNTKMPLLIELGPGLLTRIYDGIQRPLPILREKAGDFIGRGLSAPALDREKKWAFKPKVKKGDKVGPCSMIGTVQEAQNVQHRVMIPPNLSGTVKDIFEDEFTIEDTVCVLENDEKIKLMHKWPVRVPRPYTEKLAPDVPLITGQRIFDTLFPVAKGGTAAIPGPFGSGKTVMQHQLSKWSDTELVVYIGCGERGNEMTEVLTEFPKLSDPKTGRPLMERTVLIANTSNMPVAAREASVYTGITIAEYYRDMGYNVSLMADSTSRWAEALREISSRLEEMPGEEGYPAYLGARLSSFYERAGRVKTLNKQEGSITVIGAVSPPGGDFSEPVTQNTLRIVKVFWALDSKLAERRHFPSINWLTSYSLYANTLNKWFAEKVAPDWVHIREWTMKMLQKEAELQEIVQLVGSDALPENEQLILEVARMIREYFLQQNAYHEIDTYTSIERQYGLLMAISRYNDLANTALSNGFLLDQIVGIKSRALLSKVKFEKDFDNELRKVVESMESEFASMSRGVA